MFTPCYPIASARCACGLDNATDASLVNVRAWMGIPAMFRAHFYQTYLRRRSILWTTPLQPHHLAALCWSLGQYGHAYILPDRLAALYTEATREPSADEAYLAAELRRVMHNAHVLASVSFRDPSAPGFTVAKMRALVQHERRVLLDPLRNDLKLSAPPGRPTLATLVDWPSSVPSSDLPVRLAVLAAIQVAIVQNARDPMITGRNLGSAVVDHCKDEDEARVIWRCIVSAYEKHQPRQRDQDRLARYYRRTILVDVLKAIALAREAVL